MTAAETTTSIPTGTVTARVVQYDRYGSADALRVRTVPVPAPGAGQVRVRVRTAGLNPFDSKVRIGAGPYRSDGPFPRGVGQDFAGTVDAVGDAVSDPVGDGAGTTAGGRPAYHDGTPVAPGDDVIGWADRCAMSEFVVVGADALIRRPAGLGWDLAGALPTPARTAQTGLDLLGVGAGDVVLLGAAAGGVGSLLAQLAIARGARVIGTASAGNADFLASLGVVPVEYGAGLADRVRATGLTPTAAIDCHGREVVDTASALGLPPGRIITIVRHDVTRELGLADPGFPARTAGGLRQVVDAVVAHAIEMPVRAYPLDRVGDAFAELDGGHVRGKLVLRLDAAAGHVTDEIIDPTRRMA